MKNPERPNNSSLAMTGLRLFGGAGVVIGFLSSGAMGLATGNVAASLIVGGASVIGAIALGGIGAAVAMTTARVVDAAEATIERLEFNTRTPDPARGALAVAQPDHEDVGAVSDVSPQWGASCKHRGYDPMNSR